MPSSYVTIKLPANEADTAETIASLLTEMKRIAKIQGVEIPKKMNLQIKPGEQARLVCTSQEMCRCLCAACAFKQVDVLEVQRYH